MTNTQRPDERVEAKKMTLGEWQRERLRQIEADRDAALDRAERAESEAARVREAVNDKLSWTYKRHADYMEKYGDMEDAGRKKDAVLAEQRARWTDVAHSRGYRDALLFVKGEMQRAALAAAADDESATP